MTFPSELGLWLFGKAVGALIFSALACTGHWILASVYVILWIVDCID